MDTGTFQDLSQTLCKHLDFHRIGGYDPETGLAWACWQRDEQMFHLDVATVMPAYEYTFSQVTRFQEWAACVKDDYGTWSHHILPDGNPAYCLRYLSVGLFFDGLADAQDINGCFHINHFGRPMYFERYERVGHFRHGLAQAMNNGKHFHIHPDGTPAYKLRGLRNGPFQEEKGQILAWTEVRKQIKDIKRIVRVWINTQGEIVIDDSGGEIIDQ